MKPSTTHELTSESFESPHGNYRVHRYPTRPGLPWAVYLHGGPGYNSLGEREVIAPGLREVANVLWFDLLGCGESKANDASLINWSNSIADVAALARHFAREPVFVMGHCIAAPMTHELMKHHRDTVRGAIWYSPVVEVSRVYRHVLRRALNEGRLVLNDDEVAGIDVYMQLSDAQFTPAHVMQTLELLVRMRDFQSLYWRDETAMARFNAWLAQVPMAPEVFVRTMTDYFDRPDRTLPSYAGVPTLILHSDDDPITPWAEHGALLHAAIPHAEVGLVPRGAHFLQFERTADCLRQTADFLRRNG